MSTLDMTDGGWSRWPERNGDFVVAAGATVLLIVCAMLAPTPDCANDVTLSPGFRLAAWGSGLGFPLASLLCFVFRKSIASKFAWFGVGLLASLFALGTLAHLSSPAGFGFRDSERGTRTMQSMLQEAARTAPPGHTTYWLGPEFEGAKVVSVNAWYTYQSTTYRPADERHTDAPSVLLRSYPNDEERMNPTSYPHVLRVRTDSGQIVSIAFLEPENPSPAQLQAARAALTPMPADVTYEGCAG